MEELLRAERRSLPIGATLVIVTSVVTNEMLDILLALRRAGHPVTLICVSASRRASLWARDLSADRLQAQGITYYFIESIGDPHRVEQLAFR